MTIMTPSGRIVRSRSIRAYLKQLVARLLLTAVVVLVGWPTGAPVPAAQAATDSRAFRYFAETGHNLSGRARAFYEQNGGEALFGLPLTEQIKVGDLTVQYFERARFEMHPQGIILSPLGRAAAEGHIDSAFTWLSEAPAADRTFYPQSGHSLGGAFGWFWQSWGGLPRFGYPISEELVEGDLLVQYFERARFEYHPEHASRPGEVQLSQLGREAVQRDGLTPEQLAPAPPIGILGQASITIPSVAAHNAGLAAEQIDSVEVAAGEEFSFLRTLGPVSAAQGYQEGQAIVGGIVTTTVGGGICYVSTALYRAAFLAGLPISERRPHSLVLTSLNDTPGFDAAVDTAGPDLRWRNDTPFPIVVAAEINAGQLIVTLWGAGDGRSTRVSGPVVHSTASSRSATISRVVVAADGTLLRRESVRSIQSFATSSAPRRARTSPTLAVHLLRSTQ